MSDRLLDAMRVGSAGLAAVLLATACGGGVAREALPPLAAQVRELHAQGQRLLERGERERAKVAFEDARQLAESVDDLPGLAQALNALGAVASLEGTPADATDLHGRALALAEKLGRPDLQAEALAHLGTALQLSGRHDQAKALYEQALALVRQTDDRHSEAVLLNNVGLLEKRAGQPGQAEASFQAALAINQGLGDKQAQAANLVNLGLLAEEAGQLDGARARFEQALELDKTVENREAIAADLANLSRVAEKENRKEAALAYAQRAYWSYRALGDTARALSELQHALALSREQGRQVDVRQLEAEFNTLRKAAPASGEASP